MVFAASKGFYLILCLTFFYFFFILFGPKAFFVRSCALSMRTHTHAYTHTHIYTFFFIIILKFFLFYILFSVLAALLQPSVAALTAFTHRCEEKNKIYIHIYSTYTHLKKFQCPPAAGICVLKITTKKKKKSATTTKNRQIKV